MKNLQRKKWFRGLKKIMRLFMKESKFVYLGGKIQDGSLIVSNHVDTNAPLAWELYSNVNFRFWGANEMNSGLVSLYKYQTRVCYHEKKHWNLHLARLFCLIASPLTVLFYKGLDLISTYRDINFTRTIKETIRTPENKQSVVVFPEDSTKGYLDELEGFRAGFVMAAARCLKRALTFPCTSSITEKARRHTL